MEACAKSFVLQKKLCINSSSLRINIFKYQTLYTRLKGGFKERAKIKFCNLYFVEDIILSLLRDFNNHS